MKNDVCTCVKTISERRELAKVLLTLNQDDLNDDTVHSLSHAGFCNIRIVGDYKVPACIINETEGWKKICRTIQLNRRYLVEEISIEDGIVTGTYYRNPKHTLLHVYPSIIVEADEVSDE